MLNHELFRNLMDQARVVLAFMREHEELRWPDGDDRSPYERAADFVAERAGYTAMTTPTFDYVSSAMWIMLRGEAREDRGSSKVDQMPEYTP